mmetsp:Transcript_6848/g.15883  ORF Transcript_6848/g.15883 Transcript_6848/m.15883 type:complete len:431 (-) Transcript_6848:68-1360(-)
MANTKTPPSPSNSQFRLKSRRSFHGVGIDRETISKEAFHDSEKDDNFASLDDDLSKANLRRVWSTLSGLWHVHSTFSGAREEPFHLRETALLPRSKESGESVLARHNIAAICCKGCKYPGDTSPGQDNFSSSRLPGGFRLHCIADGHGEEGSWVSDRIVRVLPYVLSSRDCRRMLRDGHMEQAFMAAFERLQEDLVSASRESGINLQLSGSTAACILRQIHSPVVWVACTGDSRVIHVSRDGKVSFASMDHKPSNPSERQRVIMSGCEITTSDAANGEVLEKICVLGQRGKLPELGFTRSLGDLMYKKYGVTARPEVYKLEQELGDGAGHFLLASDGVWEFMSNEDVAAIIHRNLANGVPKESIVRELLQVAQDNWKEHEFDYCDDISLILVPAQQVTAAPPAPDDSCFGGALYASEECLARVDKLCVLQ